MDDKIKVFTNSIAEYYADCTNISKDHALYLLGLAEKRVKEVFVSSCGIITVAGDVLQKEAKQKGGFHKL